MAIYLDSLNEYCRDRLLPSLLQKFGHWAKRAEISEFRQTQDGHRYMAQLKVWLDGQETPVVQDVFVRDDLSAHPFYLVESGIADALMRIEAKMRGPKRKVQVTTERGTK